MLGLKILLLMSLMIDRTVDRLKLIQLLPLILKMEQYYLAG
jgi:hypothetical protein